MITHETTLINKRESALTARCGNCTRFHRRNIIDGECCHPKTDNIHTKEHRWCDHFSRIHPDDVWELPPDCAGQIIERAYRYDPNADRIIERVYDRAGEGGYTYRSCPCPEEYDCDFHNWSPDLAAAACGWTLDWQRESAEVAS